MLWRGFALVFVPLAILLGPLLDHHSPSPEVGPWSWRYAASVGAAWLAAAAVSFALGWLARSRRSLVPPAYALFLLVLLVAAFGVAEVVLTIRLRGDDSFDAYRGWGHERSMLFGFEAAPSHAWEGQDARYSTDRYGFRSHAADPEWETRSGPRLFVVGGSSVFGYGLDDDATWPHALEQRLRAQPGREDVRVVNAGNNGFNSLQVLLKYYLRVAPQSPTHVVYYGGFNDVWLEPVKTDSIFLTEEILFSPSVAVWWARRNREYNPYARSLSFYVVARALGLEAAEPASERVPADGARMRERGVVPRDPALPTPEVLAPLSPALVDVALVNGAVFRRNVRTLVLAAQADGVTPVLTTFIHALPPRSERARMLAWHNEILRELAASEGVLLVDLEDRFRSVPKKASYFQKDRYHPGPGAVELISTEIARSLAQAPLEAEGRWP